MRSPTCNPAFLALYMPCTNYFADYLDSEEIYKVILSYPDALIHWYNAIFLGENICETILQSV
jgi:hypothetical protein